MYSIFIEKFLSLFRKDIFKKPSSEMNDNSLKGEELFMIIKKRRLLYGKIQPLSAKNKPKITAQKKTCDSVK